MNMHRSIHSSTCEQALEAALRDLETLFTKMQVLVSACLPEGDRQELLGDVIELLDGPEQRAAQARARHLLGHSA